MPVLRCTLQKEKEKDGHHVPDVQKDVRHVRHVMYGRRSRPPTPAYADHKKMYDRLITIKTQRCTKM